jgi:hypothetical protein
MLNGSTSGIRGQPDSDVGNFHRQRPAAGLSHRLAGAHAPHRRAGLGPLSGRRPPLARPPRQRGEARLGGGPGVYEIEPGYALTGTFRLKPSSARGKSTTQAYRRASFRSTRTTEALRSKTKIPRLSGNDLICGFQATVRRVGGPSPVFGSVRGQLPVWSVDVPRSS